MGFKEFPLIAAPGVYEKTRAAQERTVYILLDMRDDVMISAKKWEKSP
jgi:hypothetical protein